MKIISNAKETTQTINFESKLNDRVLPYTLILPEKYDQSDRAYPVLYLLHGLHGSHENWTSLT
ncbi:MAG: hypothetical protein KDB79_06215, partial [Acidobacteria bacterium]|nr:hypothetical protein [Acidobacteriota bacterium]